MARAELLEVTTAAAGSAAHPEEMLRQGTLAFFRYVENRPAWSLMCAETAVAGDPAVTAEQATVYLMDLVWTGLAAAR